MFAPHAPQQAHACRKSSDGCVLFFLDFIHQGIRGPNTLLEGLQLLIVSLNDAGGKPEPEGGETAGVEARDRIPNPLGDIPDFPGPRGW